MKCPLCGKTFINIDILWLKELSELLKKYKSTESELKDIQYSLKEQKDKYANMQVCIISILTILVGVLY